MAYTKLFSSIITSTIWTEDDKTRIVWITMLALCDKNGEVQGSIPGLARLAGVSVDDCEKAVLKFLSPDKHSRTKDDEGRRIEEIEGGWHLLNHAKYRKMASKDEAQEANASRQARHRERKKRNAKVTQRNTTVTQDRDIADANAHSNAPEEEDPTAAAAESSPLRFAGEDQQQRQHCGGSIPTLEEAMQKVGSTAYPLKPEWVVKWHADRESVGWEKRGQPIRNWQADLKSYALNWKINDDAKKAFKP